MKKPLRGKSMVVKNNKKSKPEGYIFGRPTVYKADFCDIAIRIMRKGYSRTHLACELGVIRETLKEWERVHPDFSEAMKKADELAEKWWEKHARKNIYNKDFNTKLWDINMQNRFKWSKKTESNGTITVKHEDLLKDLE